MARPKKREEDNNGIMEFKLKLHFYLLLSGYYIVITKHHAKEFHKCNSRLQKSVKKIDKLLLGERLKE